MRRTVFGAAVVAALGVGWTASIDARAQEEAPAEAAEGEAEKPPEEPERELFAGSAKDLVAAHAGVVTVVSIGASRGKRSLDVLTIRPAADAPVEWVALVVAGLDGSRDPMERRLALDVAAQLAAKAGDFPAGVAFQVLADPNPDASAFSAYPRAGNDLPVDEDQDGEVDEDGPDDVNGDGAISWMRFPDPTGDLSVEERKEPEPTPETPVWADPAKGKPRTHALAREGRDSDDDFAWNEDGAGGVDLSRNFTYRFAEHVPLAGRWAASEPETRAIMDHLLADERIALTYEFGAAETVAKMPKFNDAWTKLPDADNKLYEGLRELHGKGAELERKEHAPGQGSFGAAIVHQLGRIWLGRAPMGRSGPQWPAAGTSLPEHLQILWEPLRGSGLPKGTEFGKIVPAPGKTAPTGWAKESDAAVQFLLDAAAGRARLTFEKTGASGEPGVVRFRTRLVNGGRLPTHTERGADVRGRRPINVSLQLPEGATLLAGKSHRQVEQLAGGASGDEMRYVVQGPSGGKVVVVATSPDAGTTVLEVMIP